MRIECKSLVALGALLVACEPPVIVPPPPVRDAPRYDADLDAPIPIVMRRDAPGMDVPELDAPDEDGGDPDFDGGTVLEIEVDGLFDEPEWADAAPLASSAFVESGLFAGCSLTQLRATADDVYVYVAIEGVLCAGVLFAYIDTGAPGVSLATGGLGDMTGDVDTVLSRVWLGTLGDTPRFGWGTTSLAVSATAAGDDVGWRTLSQDGAHRHFTTDLTACTDLGCETRVARADIGSPSQIRIAVRIAIPGGEAAIASLPFDSAGDSQLNTFAAYTLP